MSHHREIYAARGEKGSGDGQRVAVDYAEGRRQLYQLKNAQVNNQSIAQTLLNYTEGIPGIKFKVIARQAANSGSVGTLTHCHQIYQFRHHLMATFSRTTCVSWHQKG